MERVQRSFVVFRDLLAALRQDLDILFFPVLSAVFATLAAAGVIVRGHARGAFEGGAGWVLLAVLGYGLAAYLVVCFVVTFFAVAVVRSAQERLEGGDQRITDGLKAPLRRLPQVLAWTLASATAGVVLRLLEGRAPKVDRAVVAKVGGPWSAASHFVLPVLVFEDRGLHASMKRSVELVDQTWGEAFADQVGIGPFVSAAGAVPLILPAVLGVGFGSTGAIAGLAIALLCWIALGVLSSALFAIHVTSLYYYATTGEVAEGVSEAMLAGAHAARP